MLSNNLTQQVLAAFCDRVVERYADLPEEYRLPQEDWKIVDKHLQLLHGDFSRLPKMFSSLPKTADWFERHKVGFGVFAALNTVAPEIAPMVSGVVELSNGKTIVFATMLDWEGKTPPVLETKICLPEAIVNSFYEYCDGASFNSGNFSPAFGRHRNLPFGALNWNTLEYFRSTHSLRKNAFSEAEAKIGSLYEIRIWIQTNNDDLFLINPSKLDRRVFVCLNMKGRPVREIINPTEFFDDYCVRLFSGEDVSTEYLSRVL